MLADLEADENLGSAAIKQKALYRRARAEEEMRLDSVALVSYRAVLAHHPGSEEALKGEFRVLRKLKESSEGSYDWERMHEQSFNGRKVARLDVGDYLGPICVQEAPGRGGGRGIFAKRAISAGELLVVEKAFAAESPDPQRMIMSLNLVTNLADSGGHTATVASIIDKIMDDGSLSPVLESLYAGPTMPPPVSFPSSTSPDLDVKDSAHIDTARIETICTFN